MANEERCTINEKPGSPFKRSWFSVVTVGHEPTLLTALRLRAP